MLKWLCSGLWLCLAGCGGGAGEEPKPAKEPRPELVVNIGHGSGVTSVAFSSDGTKVLTGSYDGSVVLWDAASGRNLHVLRTTPLPNIWPHESGTVSAAAFGAAEGKVVAATSKDYQPLVVTWDTDTARQERRSIGDGGGFRAMSPDGRLMITKSLDKPPVVWNTKTGEKVWAFEDYKKASMVIAFDPGGRNLLVRDSGGEVVRWNAETGKQLQTYRNGPERINALACSPDGRWVVAGCYDGVAALWDAEADEKPRITMKHDDSVRAVAVSSDGKVVLTGSQDNTAALWDATTGRRWHTLRGHSGEVSAVAISPDGTQALTGSHDNRVILWEVKSGKKLRTFSGRRVSNLLAGVGLQGRQAVFALPNDQRVIYLDTTSGKQIRRVQKDNFLMSGRVEITLDGKGVVIGSSQAAAHYDAATGKRLKVFNGHQGYQLPGLVVGRNSRQLLTAGDDKKAMLWDMETGHRTHLFTGHRGPLTSAVMYPKEDRVLTGSADRTAILWDVAKGVELHRLRGHTGTVTSVAVSPDGSKLLTGSFDKTARLWDAATGKRLRTFAGHRHGVQKVLFTGGGQNVLTISGESTLTLWDADKGTKVWTSATRDHPIDAALLSEDETQLVTVGFNGTVCRWKLTTGRELARIYLIDQDNEWLVVTPEGYFDGSPDACQHVSWRVGEKMFPLEQFAERFHRPDLVARALAGEPSEKEARPAQHDLAAVEVPQRAEEPFYQPEEPETPSPFPVFLDKREAPAAKDAAPQLLPPEGHKGSISSVAFSPDGRLLLTGGDRYDRAAFLWDVDSGRVLKVFRIGRRAVTSVDFSPKGDRIIIGQGDGVTTLWDIKTGEQLREFRNREDDHVRSVAFSPDGDKVLIAGNDTTPVLWDADTGEKLVSFAGHTDWVYSLAFSPDGAKVVTGSGDDTAAVWDADTGKRLQTFGPYEERVKSVAFSPGGRDVLIGVGSMATLCDASTGKTLKVFDEGPWIRGVNMSPDGRWAATNAVSLWDIKTGKKRHALGHIPAASSLAFTPDGSGLLTGGSDRIAILWDIKTGRQRQVFHRPLRSLDSISVSPDGSRLIAGEQEKGDYTGTVLSVWDLDTGKRVLAFRDEGGIWDPAFLPDGKQVLANVGGQATLWDATTGKKLRVFPSGPALTGMALSPDGRQIVAGTTEKAALLLDAATGKTVQTLAADAAVPYSFSFSPDGRHALANSNENRAILWSVTTGKVVHSFPGMYAFDRAGFSRDGRLAITGDKDAGQLVLWDVDKGARLKTIGDDGFISAIAVSPDPKTPQHVLTGRLDGLVVLWDIDTGKKLREFRGHVDVVTAIAFSPNGARAYTASSDSTIRVWDTATGRELARMFNLDDYDQWLTVTPQGYYDGSAEGCRRLAWQVGDQVYPVTTYEKEYHRPDVVVRALRGGM